MERLTVRDKNGNAKLVKNDDENILGILLEVIDRVADYEDLGILAEQVRDIDKAYTELCVEFGKYKKLEERICNMFYGQLTLVEIVDELEQGSMLRTLDAARTVQFKSGLNEANKILDKLFERNESAKRKEKEIIKISPKLSLEFESERSRDGTLYALSVYAIVNGKSEDVVTWTQCNDMKEEIAYLLNCYI